MHTPKISIIIPFYNAAAYIEKCVRSVMNQTLREIEIILVNDGSTDNSLSVIKSLAAEDERLLVFNTVNKGVSAARNIGLENTKGEFIGFADADDWMEPGMYEQLYSAVKKNDCDWAVCNVNVIEEDRFIKTRFSLEDKVIDIRAGRTTELQQLMWFKYDNANWNKLYSSAVIARHQLRFKEKMNLWEDLLFNLFYLQFASKMVLLSQPLYNYRIHNASLSGKEEKDLVEGYNLLNTGFRDFAREHQLRKELTVFKAEIAKGFYYQLIHQLEKQHAKKHPSVISFFRHFYADLKRIDPAITVYAKNELSGVQGFKKRLLNKKYYFLFSLLVALNHFLFKNRQPAAATGILAG